MEMACLEREGGHPVTSRLVGNLSQHGSQSHACLDSESHRLLVWLQPVIELVVHEDEVCIVQVFLFDVRWVQDLDSRPAIQFGYHC